MELEKVMTCYQNEVRMAIFENLEDGDKPRWIAERHRLPAATVQTHLQYLKAAGLVTGGPGYQKTADADSAINYLKKWPY